MPTPAATQIIAPDSSIFEIARTKATRGHKTWLIWLRRDGTYEGRPYAAEAIRLALLASGTQGRFWWYDEHGTGHMCRSWRYGVQLWRVARRGEG